MVHLNNINNHNTSTSEGFPENFKISKIQRNVDSLLVVILRHEQMDCITTLTSTKKLIINLNLFMNLVNLLLILCFDTYN